MIASDSPPAVGERSLRRLGAPAVASALLLLAALCFASLAAHAELPETGVLLTKLGFTPEQQAEIRKGEIVRHAIDSASPRELTTAMAVAVPVTPEALVENAKRDLFDAVDPNILSHGSVSEPARPEDFSKLSLRPEEVEAFLAAEPGGSVHLSSEEIATFQGLDKGASGETVSQAVREMLAERANAYRQSGLAGIAPYALSGGEERSPAQEITTATKATKAVEQYAPAAHRHLLAYPKAAPDGTLSAFRWSHFMAHGEPAIVLTHMLMMPDADAWILAKRHFYVSAGYNAEQECGAFLPTSDAGTVVVYANRTSTDQVTGFGGGAKRSIGSKLLSSQIEGLLENARKKVE